MTLVPKGLDHLLSRTVSALSRQKLLTPLFEQALLREQAWPEQWAIKIYNKERVWDGYFHPSGDCDTEPLQLYYQFHPQHRKSLIRERPHPSLVMIFQTGAAYHAMMQSMFLHLGLTTEAECEVGFKNHELHVSGTVDVRKVFLPDGRTPPVELKSCGFLPKEPYAKHIMQLQVYMDLGCETKQETGILFYMEKSGEHRLAEFVIQRDEALLEQIYGKWAQVWEAVQASDPSGLFDCCRPNSATHIACPAREVCRIGAPLPSGVS